MKHDHTTIIAGDGQQVQAQAPVIVSASRATDIPAFYAPWFFDRLGKGHVRWRNPFSGRDSYVSFAAGFSAMEGSRAHLTSMASSL